MGGLGEFGTGLARGVKRSGRAVLDFVLPPLCLKCRTPVGDPQSLCGECWGKLKFLGEPMCACCGLPFPHALGAGVKCAACTARPPTYARARSALIYDDESRELILPFKHGDRLEAAQVFARWMKSAASDLLGETDLVMPVPLHWRRLLKRRYNQAAVLAQLVGKRSQIRVDCSTLTRALPTLSQGEMPSARARLRNVAKAFAVSEAKRSSLSGRRVLLVDDVLTTGATINACAKTLLRAGAISVSAVTLARVVRPLSVSL